MLAHVPKEKVEGAYNRAAYLSRRREIARIWATMLSDGRPDAAVLTERSAKGTGERPRRHLPATVAADFPFPVRASPVPTVLVGGPVVATTGYPRCRVRYKKNKN